MAAAAGLGCNLHMLRVLTENNINKKTIISRDNKETNKGVNHDQVV